MRTPTNSSPGARSSRARLLWLAGALALSATFALATTAGASQPITDFEVTTSTTQAGDHPDLTTTLTLGDPGQPESAKNVIVNLPVGLFGNPQAITTCRAVDFSQAECPVSSQAGLATIRANFGGDPDAVLGTAPLFNMEAQTDEETARFALIVPGVNVPITIPVAVRTADDYGLRMAVSGITQMIPLSYAAMTIWGFPADRVHDRERFRIGSPGSPPGCPGEGDAGCISQDPRPSGIQVHPLTINPSTCTGAPLEVRMEVHTYQDPANPSEASDTYPATTGCEKATFNPALNLNLTSHATDSPAGLDIQLNAPQFESFAVSPSNIRSATLTLPEGLTINPDAADGQTACADELANFDTEGPAECPDNSKIGTFDIRTPALTGPLTGSLYFGEPRPGNQYRIFMVASGFGINAKLVASVDPDPETGQLTMGVTDLPQVPFDQFNLHLFASQRGLVATPTRCLVFSADSLFIPWNPTLAPQRSRPIISLTSGPNGKPCPGQVRPFNPRLVAGMPDPTAGAFSSFSLKLDRDDGDQFLGDLNFRLPPGFTGSLRGIPYCSEASILAAANNLGRSEQANPSCPAPSQVGTTNVAAGPGTHPFNAVGKMYLAGPLKGAPLSLAAVTPALAGPYDYGVVVVRVALHVDPLTAQVKAVSDKVPQIIGGVPIRMRSIRVNIDRPNFTINPTNCSNFTVDSQGIGDQGSVTDFSSPFHAVNCSLLPFKPRMKATQLDRKRSMTNRNRNPALRFELFTRPGDANIKSLAVTLPKAFAIDQRHLGNICSKAQLAAERCKGRQPIGTVETRTPLLDEPLKGPAYAVSGFGLLPQLAFILDGQVTLIPRAESSSVGRGNLRTVVPTVPDAPIGYFKLDLLGGKQGYLINSRSLCGKGVAVQVAYTAQSGRTSSQKVPVRTPCPKAAGSRAPAKSAAR